MLFWSGKWKRVASSTELRISRLFACGKNRKIKAVASSSTFLVRLNLKPLKLGESNSANAATIFLSSTCERAAVLDDTTTRIITS